MKPSSTRITGTSAQLKPVKSERSWMPRSGKPSAAQELALDDLGRTTALAVDVVGPAVHGARARACASRGRSSPDARRRGRAGRARRRARFAIRARAMLPMLLPAVRVRVMTTVTPARRSKRAQPQRDVEDEVGLADPRHDAARPTAVLDLAGRRAGADRLGLRVCEPVVSRVDHDDRARRQRPAPAQARATAPASERPARITAAGSSSASRRR